MDHRRLLLFSSRIHSFETTSTPARRTAEGHGVVKKTWGGFVQGLAVAEAVIALQGGMCYVYREMAVF